MLILPSPACGWATVSVQTAGLPTLSSCGLTVSFPDSLKTETQLLVCYDEGVVWAFAASVPASDPEKLHTDHAAVMATIIEL